MELSKIAENIIRLSSLTDSDKDFLIRDFCMFVEVDEARLSKGSDATLGTSLLRGSPHMPESLEWPEGYYFLAQLNFAEITAIHPFPLFPTSGWLYIFFNPMAKDFLPVSSTAAKFLFYEGPVNNLSIRKTLPKMRYVDNGKYYYREFVECASAMSFTPAFTFSIVPPRELLIALESSLQMKYVKESGCTVRGKAQTWQGEDEDSLFAPSGWDWKTGPPARPGNLIMIFQAYFGEGNVHFWIEEERLLQRDFSIVYVTASIT